MRAEGTMSPEVPRNPLSVTRDGCPKGMEDLAFFSGTRCVIDMGGETRQPRRPAGSRAWSPITLSALPWLSAVAVPTDE